MTICVKCCDKEIEDALLRAFEVAVQCRECGGSWVEVLLYAGNNGVPRREESACPHCGTMNVIPAHQARDNCTAAELGVKWHVEQAPTGAEGSNP